MAEGKILDVIPSAVTVVTAQSDGKLNGMTVAWISQVSYNPALIAISITSSRYTYAMIEKTKVFGVNILHQDAVDTAKHFGYTSGKNVDKFENIDYALSESGLPILEKAVSHFLEAKVISSHEAGDHKIIVAEVIDIKKLSDKTPLIFKSAEYF